MLIPAIGAAIGIGSSIYGKHREAGQRRKLGRFIDSRAEELDNWYRKEANTNYMDTAEGQSQYQALRRVLRDNSKRVDNSLVKTGGTAESKVAEMGQMGQAAADATRQMAGMGDRRQNYLRNIYQRQRGAYDGMKMGQMEGQADAWSTFANNAGQVAGNWIGVGAEGGGNLLDFLKKGKAAGGTS